MSHSIRVNAGHLGVVLPNGRIYDGPVEVVLTDSEFDAIPHDAFATGVLADLAGVDDPIFDYFVNKLGDTMTGELALPSVKVVGKNGLMTRIFVGRSSVNGAPTSGTWAVDDEIMNPSGAVWRCTVAGTPGTWVEISGGVGVSSHRHVQSPSAAVWTVNHNLGYRPGGIYVEDSSHREMRPRVEHINANTLTLSFFVNGIPAATGGEADIS